MSPSSPCRQQIFRFSRKKLCAWGISRRPSNRSFCPPRYLRRHSCKNPNPPGNGCKLPSQRNLKVLLVALATSEPPRHLLGPIFSVTTMSSPSRATVSESYVSSKTFVPSAIGCDLSLFFDQTPTDGSLSGGGGSATFCGHAVPTRKSNRRKFNNVSFILISSLLRDFGLGETAGWISPCLLYTS